MKYKNCGFVSKTFYDIQINPGETKDFPGYVNSSNIIRIFEDKHTKIGNKEQEEKPSPKSSQRKSSGRPSKSSKPNINLVDDNISEDEILEQDSEKEKK